MRNCQAPLAVAPVVLLVGSLLLSMNGCGKSDAKASGTGAANPGGGAVAADESGVVNKGPNGPAVMKADGTPVDGIKLSQHDLEVDCPSIAVGTDGVIHVAFVEKHRTTYALGVYHRSSSDGGKSWSEAKNLSEDMPDINVGKCEVLVDGQNRTYVIWRAGLKPTFPASPNITSTSSCNLWYRVMSADGRWSVIKPVAPPDESALQHEGTLSYFAGVDGAGRVQLAFNTFPDHYLHRAVEHTYGPGSGYTVGPYVGNGLVMQVTLDGANASPARQAFMTAISDSPNMGKVCDGLNSLTGYFDASGTAHFAAAAGNFFTNKPGWHGEVIDGGKISWKLELPDLSFHGYNDVPTLLTDAKGKQHLIVLYPTGERPNVRDYVVGSDDEPTVIRAAKEVDGRVLGMQAFAGAGGRMAVLMQFNDSGKSGAGDFYVSTSDGGAWSEPVNVTNNAGRSSFHTTQTSMASHVAVAISYYPGIGAATFDKDGHLLLVMVNNESAIVDSNALGVSVAGGSVSTPTLRFLKL